MPNEIPESLVSILSDMQAQITLLHDTVVLLSAIAIPPDILDRQIERLSTPIAGDTPEATESIHKAISRFLDDLHELRSITKD